MVLRDQAGKTLREAGYFIGRATNNVAEYQALVRGLEAARELGATRVDLRADSELMVRQVEGRYKVKSADLKPLHARAMELLGEFEAWEAQHVRREKNTRADELANIAMDQKRDVEGLGSMRKDETLAVGTWHPDPSLGPLSLAMWEAELVGRNDECWAGCGTGNSYLFCGTTPEYFCLYAAAAMLNDGPLQWPKHRKTGEVKCSGCKNKVRMRRVGVQL